MKALAPKPKEGVFAGISCVATFAAAMEVAREAEKGSTLLAKPAGAGERCLSTSHLGEIEAEMSAEEKALSESTPGFRLAPG
ncbi:MAG TPA: hypothetical protein DEA40_09820 [Parvularcula sp.]|nr:hypothetical protein [Parvularcula sp.]HBS34476.1 hypothetical protein [Parvularcula sp.]